VISVVRIALIPAVVALIVRDTDSGALGRGRDLRRRRGERLPRRVPRAPPRDDDGDRGMARPLSDKLLVAVPAIVLSLRGEFPWWATAVIVAARVA
jgi:hypothetical protein